MRERKESVSVGIVDEPSVGVVVGSLPRSRGPSRRDRRCVVFLRSANLHRREHGSCSVRATPRKGGVLRLVAFLVERQVRSASHKRETDGRDAKSS